MIPKRPRRAKDENAHGSERIAELIAHPDKPILLKGEIWVNVGIPASIGFSRDPKGLTEFASAIGADFCFFPWSEPWKPSNLKELIEISCPTGMGCGITLDGPFQRLTRKKGLISILEELGKGSRSLQSQLADETQKIAEGLEAAENSGVKLAVIGDDIGYSRGLYFSDALFRDVLMPFYRILANSISKPMPVLGWHSDGDVSKILPDLVDCGFRFFSLESECVDLLNFKRTHGNRGTLIGGIRTAWLTSGGVPPPGPEEYFEEIKILLREGGLILSSSCGLHDPKFIPILKEIYQMVESMQGVWGRTVSEVG